MLQVSTYISRVFLVLLFTFLRQLVYAQSDISKDSIKAINKLAYDLRFSNIEEGLSLNQVAITAAEKLNDDTLTAVVYSARGVLFKNLEAYDSSSFYTIRSLELREKLGVPKEIAKSYNNLGSLYYVSGQFVPALTYYFKTFNIRVDTKQTDRLAGTLNNIGNVYDEMEMPDSAIYYYEKGLTYTDGDPTILDDINLNLGMLYHTVGKAKRSLEILRNVYPNLEYPYDKALCLHNMSIAHEVMGNYESATTYVDSAQLFADSLDSHDLYRDLAKSRILIELKKNDDTLLLNYFAEYELNKDFVTEEIINSNVAEIDAKYQVDKGIKSLQLEEEKNKRMQAEAEQNTITIIILLSFLVVLSILVIILIRFYRQKRRLANLELIQKRQEIEQLMQGYELDLFEAQNFGQHEERQRIASDLHDRLGGLLAAVNLQIDSLNYSKNADKTEEIDKIKSMISEGIAEVRNISHDMRSEALKKHGLKGALQAICQSIIDSKKITVDLYLDDLTHSSGSDFEREVYKIIMELLSNTLKHANANLITLQINEIDHDLTVVYEDDGKGFSPSENKSTGLGMQNLNDRVKKLNGTWEIDSQPERGTTIIIKIPKK